MALRLATPSRSAQRRVEIYLKEATRRCRETPTIRVRYFLTKRVPSLFEGCNAVLDGEFDESGEVVDIELLHHPGAVGIHRSW